MELHKQAEELREKGLKLIEEGKGEEGKKFLLMAADKFDKAAEFSDGVAKEVRLKRAEWCRRFVFVGEVSVPPHILSKEEVKKREEERLKGESESFREYIRGNLMAKEKEKLPSWGDIGGLKETKNTIKESIVLAYARKPERVEIEGWRNILLFGPPGTGKTLLAAATAKGLDASFFNVKAGQVLSKYYGESPKIVNALFGIAREESPSVIFFDELDSIAISRGAEMDEETRRVLSTLLTELDGLSGGVRGEFLLFLASTNTPWDIDDAVISRFEKRIYVPLPDNEARRDILRIQLDKKGFEFDDYDWLMEKTEGYSGRDIKVLCKEAVYGMVRELNPGVADVADEGLGEIRKYKIKTRRLTKRDFEKALERMKPASTEDMVRRYEEWNNRFGAMQGNKGV